MSEPTDTPTGGLRRREIISGVPLVLRLTVGAAAASGA